jgi:uncharacterized protein (DUF983 family)
LRKSTLRNGNPPAELIASVGLIVLGTVLLVQSANLAWLRWLSFDTLWPLLLVIAGMALLSRRET